MNQPGSTAIAPPVTGHLVRLVDRGSPPPEQLSEEKRLRDFVFRE